MATIGRRIYTLPERVAILNAFKEDGMISNRVYRAVVDVIQAQSDEFIDIIARARTEPGSEPAQGLREQIRQEAAACELTATGAVKTAVRREWLAHISGNYTNSDKQHLQQVIAFSEQSIRNGALSSSMPVAVRIIDRNGKEVATAHKIVFEKPAQFGFDSTHAEKVAINQAEAAGFNDWERATIITNLEPCYYCTRLLCEFYGVKRVVFGIADYSHEADIDRNIGDYAASGVTLTVCDDPFTRYKLEQMFHEALSKPAPRFKKREDFRKTEMRLAPQIRKEYLAKLGSDVQAIVFDADAWNEARADDDTADEAGLMMRQILHIRQDMNPRKPHLLVIAGQALNIRAAMKQIGRNGLFEADRLLALAPGKKVRSLFTDKFVKQEMKKLGVFAEETGTGVTSAAGPVIGGLEKLIRSQRIATDILREVSFAETVGVLQPLTPTLSPKGRGNYDIGAVPRTARTLVIGIPEENCTPEVQEAVKQKLSALGRTDVLVIPVDREDMQYKLDKLGVPFGVILDVDNIKDADKLLEPFMQELDLQGLVADYPWLSNTVILSEAKNLKKILRPFRAQDDKRTLINVINDRRLMLKIASLNLEYIFSNIDRTSLRAKRSNPNKEIASAPPLAGLRNDKKQEIAYVRRREDEHG
jgi:tRNA(Arg) A34 adenosine deaminase TadA